MEQFATGATRNVDTHKYDYEGFLSPWALERFGMYMQEHRRQKDGSLRESDNWQKGIPLSRYMKSLLRHVFAVWQIQRGMHPMDPDSGQVANLEDSLCGVFFNAQGMLHEIVKTKCLKSSS